MALQKSGSAVTSAVIFQPVAGEEPRDFITWHEVTPYRVWVHSRLISGIYTQLSIEILWSGETSASISETEIKLRLEMAKIRSGDVGSNNISATLVRGIPVGQIVESHTAMLAKQGRKIANKKDKRVSLVKNYEIESFNFELGPKTKSSLHREESSLPLIEPRPENDELTGSSKDSMFIAYVYAEQVKSGSRQASLRTANLLGIKPLLVYVAVRTARKKGWLTSSGVNGETSGEITEQGHKEYERIGGPDMFKKHITDVFEEMKKGDSF